MIDITHKVCTAVIASALALLIAGGATAQDAQPDLANALKNKGARLQSLQRGGAVSAPANAKLLVEGQKSFAAAGDGPNDPVFKAGLNWHYKPLPLGMNAIGAWAKTTGAKDVVVAVLSTGILPKHPDIAGSPNLLPGYSFVSENGEKRKADATDPGQDCSEQVKASYEGTLTAGLIGAVKTNNGVAIAGLNASVSVLPVRVVSKCSVGILDLYQSILWAAGFAIEGVPANRHPANVIMIDLQAPVECAPDKFGDMIKVIEAVRAKGAVVVAPAGDGAADVKGYLPASCPGVISVAASDGKGQFASYSNFGGVTLLAPGGDPQTKDEAGNEAWVWTVAKPDAQNPQGLAVWYGTDMAAAHVSGAVALALAQHPEWRGNADTIEQKLRACAVPASTTVCPKGCGAGQLDAARLVDGQCASNETASSSAAQAPSPSTSSASAPPTAPAETKAAPKAPAESAPAAETTKAAVKAPTEAAPPAAAGNSAFAGQWLLPDGDGILVIGAKGEWIHPTHGAGRIREATDDADFRVFYNSGETRCSYRASFTEGGKTLILFAADNTQDQSYCPSGELKAGGR